MKVKSFKRKWRELKETLTDEDLKLFYEIINIDDTIGRVLTCSNRDFNPRFMSHWFPVCRCHWNVLFPLWLLNGKSLKGDYKIITNESHSAIIHHPTQSIYDPTYDANGTDLNETQKRLLDTPSRCVEMLEHAATCDKDIFDRLVKFLPKSEHTEAQRQIEAMISSYRP